MNESFDIAIVGSGAAGIAAAVTAARAGRKTILLDKNSAPGGTGGFSGLTTLCGLFDDSGNFLNDGFAREFAEAITEGAPRLMGKVWVALYRPETFRKRAAHFFAEAGVQTHFNCAVADVIVENNRIARLNGFAVGAVIDGSGSAEVARLIGAECLATDETTQASAVVFTLRCVTRPLDSIADAAQVLLAATRAGFAPFSFHPNLEPQSITVKFSGNAEQVLPLIQFLQKNVRGFEHCESASDKFQSTPRKGRMIVGEYLLTGADVLSARKFPDAVARCAWPIEQWNADGRATFKYLPAGAHYEIPARSLRAKEIKNLFMAGKTISADTDAIASARVMGCCLATGAAAGVLAARSLESANTE